MNKAEFLAALSGELASVTTEEREAALDYYSEYFADAGVENEPSVLEELGSPAQVAANIRSNCGSVPAPIRPAGDYHKDGAGKAHATAQAAVPPNNTNRTILLVLLAVVTFPIWVGFLGGAFGVLVGILATLFALFVAGIALAVGGAPLASIRMGAGDRKGAERILGNCFTLLLCISAVLTVVFLVFKEPLLYMFGASDNIIGYALDYITIYLFGTLFVQMALGLNTFISAQGQATTAMLSVLIGAIINIVLDPILIFGFHMGVKGAALATIFSQAVSAAWVLRFLFSKKSGIRIRRENIRLNKKVVASVAALGIAPFIMLATESLVSITLNSGLQKYGGDLYVGSMTIIQSIMQMIVMPVQGIVQGAQPIMSYNYGAQKYDRVRKTFFLLLRVTLTVTVLACLAIAGHRHALRTVRGRHGGRNDACTHGNCNRNCPT